MSCRQCLLRQENKSPVAAGQVVDRLDPSAHALESADHLIDPMYIQNKNSNCILTHIEEGYEHLDMIWGDSAHEKIFPKVVEVIDAVV